MKLLSVALLVLTLAVSALAADSVIANPGALPIDPNDKFLQDFYKATVVLYRLDETGSYIPSCTATSMAKLDDGYVFITASHCIEEENDYFVSEDGVPKVLWPVTTIEKGDLLKGQDFAMLLVPMPGVDFPLIPLGVNPVDVLGEPVVSVSAPLGMGKQLLRGTVAKPKINRPMPIRVNGKIIGNWEGFMLLQVPGINSASSGSAVACSNQRAICGIITGVITTSLGQEAVALPISRLEANIAAHAPKKP